MKREVNKNFVSMSSQFGIPGISYRIKLGLINEKWTLNLLKGHYVIDSIAYEGSEFLNRNELISWIISLISNPNLDSYKIKKTVETLVDQAINKYKDILLDNALNLIDEAEKLIKNYELSINTDVLLCENPYDKAILNYQEAQKIFQKIGWNDEANKLNNTIKFYKSKSEAFHLKNKQK